VRGGITQCVLKILQAQRSAAYWASILSSCIAIRRTWAAAVLLMTLPLLWTPTLFWQNALPRLAGLWGALLVSLALQRLQLSQTQKQCILVMILLAALLYLIFSGF